VIFSEDGDQKGRDIEEWFMLVCAERGEGFKPFLWRAAIVKIFLLLFRRHADLLLHF